MAHDLHGRVALVTGASRGIGAATAQVFAAAGATVILTHRDSSDAAAAVCAALPGTGHRVIQADSADTAAIDAAAGSIADTEGRLDVLVNNAAWTRAIPHADLAALDDATFDRIYAGNLRGVYAYVRACYPLLQDSDISIVVNVSSVAARTGDGSNIAYCAAKAGVETMTKSLARALAPGTRVMAVAPGFTDSPLSDMWTPEQRQARMNKNVFKRAADPAEIADTILAVVTHMTFSTGSVVLAEAGSAMR
jgi:3-oxoacyl-[acyl-carrier protein] reductase